jgi:cytoskeletal protein RodZ
MTDQKQRGNHRQTPPWERETDAESVAFGAWLRQQREMREITLREISEATKISLRYLEALEEERFDLLPATLFARGFLRQYARYVGLDPDEAVNRLLVAQKAAEPDDAEAAGERDRGGTSFSLSKPGVTLRNVLLVLGLVLVLLALVLLVPRLMERRGSGEAPPGLVPSESRAERPELPPQPPPETTGAPLTVTLDFREDCWVEASVDGEPRIAEMRVQGESLQLQAEESVELRLGDAGVVDLEVNGEPYDLHAQPGQVRAITLTAPEPEPERAPAVEAPQVFQPAADRPSEL